MVGGAGGSFSIVKRSSKKKWKNKTRNSTDRSTPKVIRVSISDEHLIITIAAAVAFQLNLKCFFFHKTEPPYNLLFNISEYLT